MNRSQTDTAGAISAIREEHKTISEELSFLKGYLPYLYDGQSFDNGSRTMDFFDKTVVGHFENEERRLFTIALAGGQPEIKKTVRRLQHEHIDILAKLDTARDIVLKYGYKFPDQGVKDAFTGALKELMEMVILHARKEDEELFPYLTWSARP